MNVRYFKQLPMLMASLGLYAATAEKKHENLMQPEGCVELCYAGPQLACDEQWDVSAAAIYFQAQAQGVDVALVTQDRTNATYPVNGMSIQPPESLNWGLKAGIGYKLFKDDWKIATRYTYFNTVANTAMETAYGTAFIPSRYTNQYIGGDSNQVYKLFNNMQLGTRTTVNNVNVIAMRPSYVDQKVQLSTYYGIDLTFMNRRNVSVYTNDVTIAPAAGPRYASNLGGFLQNYQKYTWWGVGPMVGAKGKFYVNYDVSLYADVYGALNYGSSRCRVATASRPSLPATVVTGNTLPQEAVINNEIYQFSPEFSYQLGVNWTKVTEDSTLLMGLNIGYEATYFFNVIKSLIPETAYNAEEGSGLGIQGLVLEGYLHF